MKKTLALSLAALSVTACAGGTGSELDSAVNSEYGALTAEARDDADDARAERLPEICRELIADIDMRREETSDDGRELGRGRGTVRDLETGRVDEVRIVWGERTTGRRVWFASLEDDNGRRRALLAARYEDGMVRGRVLDRDRNVRGVMRGERDGNNLRLRIRIACRDLANEGQREVDDEANADAERAAERLPEEGTEERPADDTTDATRDGTR